MSLVTLGLAGELREAGVAANGTAPPPPLIFPPLTDTTSPLAPLRHRHRSHSNHRLTRSSRHDPNDGNHGPSRFTNALQTRHFLHVHSLFLSHRRDGILKRMYRAQFEVDELLLRRDLGWTTKDFARFANVPDEDLVPDFFIPKVGVASFELDQNLMLSRVVHSGCMKRLKSINEKRASRRSFSPSSRQVERRNQRLKILQCNAPVRLRYYKDLRIRSLLRGEQVKTTMLPHQIITQSLLTSHEV